MITHNPASPAPTALERAKRFIRQNAARTALVIVPLAVASQATASNIAFEVAGATAVPGGSSGVTVSSGSGTFSSLGDGGIRFASVDDYVFNIAGPSAASGSGFVARSLTLTLSGDGDNVALMDLASLTGLYDYTFDLGQNNPFSQFSSSVAFSINGGPAGGTTPPLSNGNGVTYSESGQLPLSWVPTDTLTFWEIVLKADFVTSGDGTITLTIPPHSLDVVPEPLSADAIPEPTSLLLLASGAALLLVRQRRRAA
jgi:hypothetical protein